MVGSHILNTTSNPWQLARHFVNVSPHLRLFQSRDAHSGKTVRAPIAMEKKVDSP